MDALRFEDLTISYARDRECGDYIMQINCIYRKPGSMADCNATVTPDETLTRLCQELDVELRKRIRQALDPAAIEPQG